MPNFPASLDSLANPTATTNRDDVGFALHTVISTLNDIAEALEAKLGIGATTPDAQFKSLVGSAAGVSAWGYSTPVKLGEISGTGASGVLEIASIPATFRALELHLVGRSDTAATSAGVRLTFETSPSAGTYNHQQISGAATAVAAAENIGTSDFITFAAFPGASSPASCYGAARILIPEYAFTSFFKTCICHSSEPQNLVSGGFTMRHTGGLWESTAAISRVRLTLSAGNWTTISRLSLYGIPG